MPAAIARTRSRWDADMAEIVAFARLLRQPVVVSDPLRQNTIEPLTERRHPAWRKAARACSRRPDEYSDMSLSASLTLISGYRSRNISERGQTLVEAKPSSATRWRRR